MEGGGVPSTQEAPPGYTPGVKPRSVYYCVVV